MTVGDRGREFKMLGLEPSKPPDKSENLQEGARKQNNQKTKIKTKTKEDSKKTKGLKFHPMGIEITA